MDRCRSCSKEAGAAVVAPVVVATESQYGACQAGGVISLRDGVSRSVVSICPSAGNVVFEMLAGGENVLWFPFETLDEFKAVWPRPRRHSVSRPVGQSAG